MIVIRCPFFYNSHCLEWKVSYASDFITSVNQLMNRSALEERSLLSLLILFRIIIYFCDLISWIRSYDIFRSWFTKLSDFAVKVVPAFLATSHDFFELNGSQLQEPPSVRLSFHTVFRRPHSTSTRVLPF